MSRVRPDGIDLARIAAGFSALSERRSVKSAEMVPIEDPDPANPCQSPRPDRNEAPQAETGFLPWVPPIAC